MTLLRWPLTPTKKKTAKIQHEIYESVLTSGRGFNPLQAQHFAEAMTASAVIFRIVYLILMVFAFATGLLIGWWLS